MKHVLFLTMGYPSDYSQIQGVFFRDQAEAVAKSGLKVGLIALCPVSIFQVIASKKLRFGSDKFERNKVETRIHPFLNIPKFYKHRIRKSLHTGFASFEAYMAQNGKPDVLHLHSYQLGPLAQKIRNKYQIPFLITEHSSSFQGNLVPKSLLKIAKKSFKQANVSVAVSPKTAQVLEEKFGVSVQFVPNTVDTEVFVPKPEKKGDHSDYVFLHVANLKEVKNQTLLIHSFFEFLKKYNHARLRIIGGGDQEEVLKKLTNDLGIASQVEFLGPQNRESVVDELQRANAFLLSSKIETFGVVVIEALSTGLPVVATKCGGPESILSQAGLGVLCEQNETSFSAGMIEVFENPEIFDPVLIRKHTVDNYSNQAIAMKLVGLYEKITEENEEK